MAKVAFFFNTEVVKKAAMLVAAVWLFFTAIPLQAKNLEGEIVNICDDAAEWPPYIFYKRDTTGEKTKELIGISVDLLREIFDKQGIRFTVELRPWARCQKEVELGEDFQLALNASYNQERAEKYYLSLPYYSTSSYYFYSKKHNPNGLDIKNMADLKKYSVCGKNHKHSKELKRIIDEGIGDLKKSGKLEQILKKYIP